MSSLLDKALAALLNEDIEQADKLFHEFVLQRASQVNESIVSGQSVDVDGIVEGKSYKKNDEDGDSKDAKKKEDQERKEGAKKKRDLDESEEAVEEGKSFKRNRDDDADDKKKKDQERKDGAKQKRDSLDEAANGDTIEAHGVKGVNGVKWRKTFRDEAALAAWIDANDAEVEGQRDLDVNEGQLTAVQGDDGTLTITHEPAGAAPAPVEAMPLNAVNPDMGAPVDDFSSEVGDEDEMGMDTDLGVSDEPLPGIDDLNDEAFESLRESLASELEEIMVNTKEGDFAQDGKVSVEKHSPLPNVAADKRIDGGAAVKIKGAEHNGFDREAAPKVDNGKGGARNTMTKSTDAQSKVAAPKK